MQHKCRHSTRDPLSPRPKWEVTGEVQLGQTGAVIHSFLVRGYCPEKMLSTNLNLKETRHTSRSRDQAVKRHLQSRCVPLDQPALALPRTGHCFHRFQAPVLGEKSLKNNTSGSGRKKQNVHPEHHFASTTPPLPLQGSTETPSQQWARVAKKCSLPSGSCTHAPWLQARAKTLRSELN